MLDTVMVLEKAPYKSLMKKVTGFQQLYYLTVTLRYRLCIYALCMDSCGITTLAAQMSGEDTLLM